MPIGYLYHDFNGPFLYTVGFDRLTLVRYLLWAKDYVQITRCLERWLQSFREGDRLAQLLEALVYLAIANYHLRRLDAAVNYLLEAFALAEPEAYLQLFRNETEDVLAILQEARPQHLESAGLGPEQSAVLLHFLEEVFPGEASSRALVVVPAHLLTARETEILRLITKAFPTRISPPSSISRITRSVRISRASIESSRRRAGPTPFTKHHGRHFDLSANMQRVFKADRNASKDARRPHPGPPRRFLTCENHL